MEKNFFLLAIFTICTSAIATTPLEVNCIGDKNAKNALIYLHGMDSIAPSRQEVSNSKQLELLAKQLDLVIALPRAKNKCPDNEQMLCWGWAFKQVELEEILPSILDSREACFLKDKPFGMMGFSNGGYLITQWYRRALIPVQNQIPYFFVATGSDKGFVPSSTSSLKINPPLTLIIGDADFYNRDDHADFYNQLLVYGAPVKRIEFQGGHKLDLFSTFISLSNYFEINVEDIQKYFIANLTKTIQDKTIAFQSLPRNLNSKEWVKQALAYMVKIDQIARRAFNQLYNSNLRDSDRKLLFNAISKLNNKIDKQNLIELKIILNKYHWIYISEFDEVADRNAWLLVQHADRDHQFQVETLKVLESLVKVNETNKTNFAYLYDRVAVSFLNPEYRIPQRFGTQGQCKSNNNWQPFKIEDIENLNNRRSNFGLGSFKTYKSLMDKYCK